MTSSTRQELLSVLAELSAACPEMRFGQLIANLSTLAKGLSAEGLWDAEDEELLAAARKQLTYFADGRQRGTRCTTKRRPCAANARPGSRTTFEEPGATGDCQNPGQGADASSLFSQKAKSGEVSGTEPGGATRRVGGAARAL
jgi:hypothetical protein